MTIRLSNCGLQTIGSRQVRICFDSLVQDSRCPVTADCIWQGVAQGRFSFTVDNTSQSFVLSTNKTLPNTITSIAVSDYQITLLNIYPYPGTVSNGFISAEVKLRHR